MSSFACPSSPTPYYTYTLNPTLPYLSHWCSLLPSTIHCMKTLSFTSSDVRDSNAGVKGERVRNERTIVGIMGVRKSGLSFEGVKVGKAREGQTGWVEGAGEIMKSKDAKEGTATKGAGNGLDAVKVLLPFYEFEGVEVAIAGWLAAYYNNRNGGEVGEERDGWVRRISTGVGMVGMGLWEGMKGLVIDDGEEEEDFGGQDGDEDDGFYEDDKREEGIRYLHLPTASMLVEVAVRLLEEEEGRVRWKDAIAFKRWFMERCGDEGGSIMSFLGGRDLRVLMTSVLCLLSNDGKCAYSEKLDSWFLDVGDLETLKVGVKVREDVEAECELRDAIEAMEGRREEVKLSKLKIVQRWRKGKRGEYERKMMGMLMKREDEINNMLLNLESVMAGLERGRDNKVVVDGMRAGLEAVRKFNDEVGGIEGVQKIKEELDEVLDEQDGIGMVLGAGEGNLDDDALMKELEDIVNEGGEGKEDVEVAKSTHTTIESPTSPPTTTSPTTTPSTNTPPTATPSTTSKLGPPLRVPVME